MMLAIKCCQPNFEYFEDRRVGNQMLPLNDKKNIFTNTYHIPFILYVEYYYEPLFVIGIHKYKVEPQQALKSCFSNNLRPRPHMHSI